MSNMSKLFKLFSFVMVLCAMFILVGCESINGPEGKYTYRENRMEKYSLVFEDDKVTINIDGDSKGSFDYEYVKDETDKNKGTVTIDSLDYPWVLTFDYEEKKLSGKIFNDGFIYHFTKILN